MHLKKSGQPKKLIHKQKKEIQNKAYFETTDINTVKVHIICIHILCKLYNEAT